MAFRFFVGLLLLATMFVVFMLKEEVPILLTITYNIELKGEAPCHGKGDTTETSQNDTKLTDLTLSENKAEIIIAAYVWGYIITIIPSAILAEKFGPVRVMTYSVYAAIFVKLWKALMYSYEATVFYRFLIGLFMGCVYPAVNILIARWAPPDEKGKFFAGTVMGSAGGVILCTYLEPALVNSSLGKYGYFVTTVMEAGIISLVLYFVTGWPEDQKFLTASERKEIKDSHRRHFSQEKLVAPFAEILVCKPFWALCFAEFCNHWSLYLVTMFTPYFKSKTMGVVVLNDRGMFILPHVGRFFGSFMYGVIADVMIKGQSKPVSKIRKFFVIFSHFVPALFFLVVRSAFCFHTAVTLFMFLHQLFNSASVVSTLINPHDLAPNFVGTCFGIMHFCGMISWLILPMISQALMNTYNNGLTAAAINYGLGAGFLIAGGVIFMVFGSGELQSWNM